MHARTEEDCCGDLRGWPRDDRQFEVFFLEHYGAVFRLLRRIVGSREEAEDLAQDVFLALHEQARRLATTRGDGGSAGTGGFSPATSRSSGSKPGAVPDTGPGGGRSLHPPPAPWLYRVAVHKGYNAVRDRGRRRRRAETEVRSRQADPGEGGSAAEDLRREEERESVREALSRMPEKQARLLLLRHAGLSYKELAAAAGIAPGSVGTLLARAERRFEHLYRGGRGAPAGRREPRPHGERR